MRASIAAAARAAARGTEPAAVSPASPMPEAGRQAAKAATRVGKKMIAAPIDPAAHRQLKMLAAEKERKSEDLIREALNLLFVNYGKLPIA